MGQVSSPGLHLGQGRQAGKRWHLCYSILKRSLSWKQLIVIVVIVIVSTELLHGTNVMFLNRNSGPECCIIKVVFLYCIIFYIYHLCARLSLRNGD